MAYVQDLNQKTMVRFPSEAKSYFGTVITFFVFILPVDLIYKKYFQFSITVWYRIRFNYTARTDWVSVMTFITKHL